MCRPTRISKTWKHQGLALAVLDSSPRCLPLPKGQDRNQPTGAVHSLGTHCKPLPWPSFYSLGCQGRKIRPEKELAPLIHLGICSSANTWASCPWFNHGRGQWVLMQDGDSTISMAEIYSCQDFAHFRVEHCPPPSGKRSSKQTLCVCRRGGVECNLITAYSCVYTCPGFAGKCTAGVVAKIWMNVVVCRCMNDCMYLWMNAFQMKCVWESLQAGVVVCRCLASGILHQSASRPQSVSAGLGERGNTRICSEHLPFPAAAVAAWTIGNCLVFPEPSGKKGRERQRKPRGQSVISWRFLQTPEIVLR